MIIAIVKAKIKEGEHAELKRIAIATILQYEFAAQEEGCEQYESFIDGDTFITIERWSDQASLDKHLKAEHVATYVPLLRACVVGNVFDVQFIESDKVSFVTI